jgi:quercetin dioxygenase-like cupin family protein
MEPYEKGAAFVLGPEDGESYWQPAPQNGYMTIKVSPVTCPLNSLAAGTQIVPPGSLIRDHGHSRNDEILFVYEGYGTATVDGEAYHVEPGSMLFLGRFVEHSVKNESDVDMKLFWVFTPPGLDNVVRGVGRPRTPGEAAPETFQRPDNAAEIFRANNWATPEQMRTTPS